MTNNNWNTVNWDEIPDDVEAVVTYLSIPTPNYYKTSYGKLMCQRYRHEEYAIVEGTLDDLKYNHGYHFHLRPSPITQPTPVPPKSTQVESSEVEATTTPEFDWSSVGGDVEAVVVSPQGRFMAAFKEDGSKLMIGSGKGKWYVTRRADTVSKYPLEQLKTGNGILLYKPFEQVVHTLGIYKEGAEGFEDTLKQYSGDSTIQTETYTPKPPSISTILQEAQQSILKHHGVTGRVKFTVSVG